MIPKPERMTLSNGIPVILQPYGGMVAATYWWVNTGSVDEAPNEAGFSHFLEHMLFKDAAAKETGVPSSGQTAQAIESLGGDINAYTSFDQTVYHVTCAEQHWEKVIDQFGLMGKPQRFLKTDFDREREVILEELRKNEDSPGRQLFQSLFSSTFHKHPYGRPVIGYVKTLKAATVASLEAYYRRQYVPATMGIVLVGPMGEGPARRKALLRALEKRYGRAVIPPRAFKRRPRPTEPALRKGIESVSRAFAVTTPSVAFAFRGPELKSEDVPALDTLVGALAQGELSRLYRKLFYDRSLVTDISGGVYIPNDPGMFYFQAEYEKIDRTAEVSKEWLDTLAEAKKSGPTAEELERVIVSAESERLYATQTVDGMAGRLGFLQFVLGDLDYDRKYLDELRSLRERGPGVVREVAEKYLDPRRMSVILMHSKETPKSEAKEALAAICSEAQRKLGASPAAKSRPISTKPVSYAPQVTTWTRPSGLRVAHCERPASHVASVHASVLGGVRLERAFPIESAEADWGLSHLLSMTWAKGTTQKSAQEISRIVEGSAASMDGFSGRNSMGLDLTALARDWDRLSDLFTEVLVDPSFPDDEVEHSRRVTEESIRSIDDHTSQVCSKLFLETLFESHPYGRLTIGSMESLKTLTARKLRAFHRRWIRPERMVISVSGAVPRAKLDRFLDGIDAAFSRSGKSETSADPSATAFNRIAEEPDLRAPRWVERHLNREQTHILIGGLGTRVDAQNRHALRLTQTLLGGQSGRLFIELREKKSLAYSVAPMSFEGIERGYVGTYIACAPQKREEALKGIQAVYEKLVSKGPTDRELSRAREYYLGRRAMDLQSDGALAAHYGLQLLYGLTPEREAQTLGEVLKVGARDVRDLSRALLVEPPMVTSIVG